ncbi:hypothetical protein WAK64_18940 [Bacillus spongiae]|uniref:Uncharacterized protein n=1 Tax=Bacillus spongiae TaxID=2683610 RepID=A0ABU8HJ00_9BACI
MSDYVLSIQELITWKKTYDPFNLRIYVYGTINPDQSISVISTSTLSLALQCCENNLQGPDQELPKPFPSLLKLPLTNQETIIWVRHSNRESPSIKVSFTKRQIRIRAISSYAPILTKAEAYKVVASFIFKETDRKVCYLVDRDQGKTLLHSGRRYINLHKQKL